MTELIKLLFLIRKLFVMYVDKAMFPECVEPGKWMELEETILSEVTQSQKDKHDPHTFLLNPTPRSFSISLSLP
ncbi:protein of unknown function DUF1725 containing protein [Cricetulus griseus]|nr:protein of unknown function DUF1725 containing protein [Cricetulus griseus]